MQDKFWREQVVPKLQEADKHLKYINSGAVYFHRTDKNMRPICWVNLRQLIDEGLTMEELVDVLDMSMGYVMANAMVPGVIEQMIIMVDTKDVRVWEIPISALRGPIKHGSHKWKMRLAQITVINLPWYVTSPVNLIKSFMPSYVAVKFRLLDSNYKDSLDEAIGLARIEEKFGGTKPNEQEFFPFKFNVDDLV